MSRCLRCFAKLLWFVARDFFTNGWHHVVMVSSSTWLQLGDLSSVFFASFVPGRVIQVELRTKIVCFMSILLMFSLPKSVKLEAS